MKESEKIVKEGWMTVALENLFSQCVCPAAGLEGVTTTCRA
jgi:hypothetical protein